MSTNPFIAALRISHSHDQRWGFVRELRRYEFAARRFRDAGIIAFAELYDGYAEQTRLEIEALAKADQRIAELDAKLSGECRACASLSELSDQDDAEATASAIAFGGPLPGRETAA